MRVSQARKHEPGLVQCLLPKIEKYELYSFGFVEMVFDSRE